MKGTDQAGSLGPDGILRMVRDIRLLNQSMGIEDIFIVPETQSAKIKLERSIASNKCLQKGDIITEGDIQLLSPGDGVQWSNKEQVIGKKLLQNIEANEIIYKKFLA